MNPQDLVREWYDILTHANDHATRASALRRLVRRLSTAETYESLKKVERDLDKLEALDLSDLPVAAQVEEEIGRARGWLDAEWERRASSIAQELREEFSDAGLPLEERDGLPYRYPFAVQLHPRKDRARLMHAGEPVGERGIPLDADRIFRAWHDSHKRLERDQTDPDLLAPALVRAYDEAVVLSERRPGVQVRLPELHFRLFLQRQTAAVRKDPRRRRIKPYPRYQFAWDLSILLQSPRHFGVAGRELRFLEATETASRSGSRSIQVDLPDVGAKVFGDLQVI